MLKLVISGGQTGADRAGLWAAKACGIATGGWMPRGFLAHDGRRPDFAHLFGLQEHTSKHYPPRTRLNVEQANATVRIARDWTSFGEISTLKYIQRFNKPWFDVDWRQPDLAVEPLVEFLKEHRVTILNVAGNSESTAPGIEVFATQFLIRVFQACNA